MEKSLPDYLRDGLDLLFVGINPGWYSAQVGHYFANRRNRFWTAFNAAGMAPEPLGPERDFEAPQYGIGFTDVVKRPTRGMAELKPAEFREGVRLLQQKLLLFQPRFICFNGVSGYRNYVRYAEVEAPHVEPGLQPHSIGRSQVYVLPSTSPANAAVPLDQLVACLRELKGLMSTLPKIL